jgi:putative membrane protein
MRTLYFTIVIAVAALHLGFLLLEMFFWTRPLGLKVFQITESFARDSRVLAANQGLYNGFLATGLLWSLFRGDFPLQVFFLVCILLAGIFGGLTANKNIILIQALPALLALVLGWLT